MDREKSKRGKKTKKKLGAKVKVTFSDIESSEDETLSNVAVAHQPIITSQNDDPVVAPLVVSTIEKVSQVSTVSEAKSASRTETVKIAPKLKKNIKIKNRVTKAKILFSVLGVKWLENLF